VFLENSIDVWQDLKERSSGVDCIHVANQRSKINNLKQGSKYVLDCFTKIRGLWEELANNFIFFYKWLGSVPLYVRYRRLFDLYENISITVANLFSLGVAQGGKRGSGEGDCWLGRRRR
jgi:hypothetical protein